MATKVTNALGYTDRGTAIVSSNTELGQNAFMNILVAELSNMDPTQDQDSTAYVTQMAEFASIEQLNNLNTTMRNFSYQQMVGQVAILNDRDADGNNKFGLITQVFKSGTYTYATVLDAATGTYSNYEISRVIGTSDSGYTSANFETALNSNFLSAKALADSGAKAVVVETETKNVTSTDSDGKTTTTSTTVTTAKKCVIKSAYLDKAGSQVNVTVAFLDDEGNETDETKVYNYTSIVIAGNLTDEVMDEAVKNHTTVTESDKDDSTEEVSSNTKSTTEGIKAAIASYAANNQKSITQENEILSKIAGIQMRYRIINGQAYSLRNFEHISNNQNNLNVKSTKEDKSFRDVLKDVKNQKEGFTVSKHAAQRLNEINFTEDDMNKIEKGFQIAKEKNSKNTVMIYKDIALIASVENKTLITAVEKERAKENIFTNVDSVVIL